MSNPFGNKGDGGGPPTIPSRAGKAGEGEAGVGEAERTLLVKGECLVYRIPPQTKAAGWKANDWNLKKPDWSGKMRLVILVFSPLVVVIFINPPGDHGEGSQDTTGG